MKGFILDSDTWIEFFRHRGGVDKHIAETPAEQLFFFFFRLSRGASGGGAPVHRGAALRDGEEQRYRA